jgi:hypothetical protein
MPVGSDVNIAVSAPSSTSTAARQSSTFSPLRSGTWTTESFTGPCICRQTMCSACSCAPTQYHTLNGEIGPCTSGTTSEAKQGEGHYGCFVDNSNNVESLICESHDPNTSHQSANGTLHTITSVLSLRGFQGGRILGRDYELWMRNAEIMSRSVTVNADTLSPTVFTSSSDYQQSRWFDTSTTGGPIADGVDAPYYLKIDI